MSDILSVSEGRKLVEETFAGIMPKEGDTVMGGFEMNGAMMEMLGGFTLLRLTGMLGMMNINMTREQLLDLNARLNWIKKS